jgi:magnesium chelatase subunit I
VFSANPEDYTARGKIVTPLKDRIGSEIRTHYPESVEEGIRITSQEAWTERAGKNVKAGKGGIEIPHYVRQVVEQIAFAAREDKKVDKRSGVSQRLPITTMELVASNAERRALLHNEDLVVARVGDIYAALPGITGKIELEYEGEMRGADTVVREIIRTAVAHVFDSYFAETNTQQIEQWFNLGGTVQLNDTQPSAGSLAELQQIQGLIEKLAPLQVTAKSRPEIAVSAAEFLLEGMYAHKRLSRTEERSFSAGEKKSRADEANRYAEKIRERDGERDDYAKNRTRRGFN